MQRNTANNINFHYRTNSVKIKDYFFNKFKNFDHFFQCFQGKRRNSIKTGSVTHNVIWVSSAMPKFRKKLMIQFQENTLKEGRTVRRYFLRPVMLLPLT